MFSKLLVIIMLPLSMTLSGAESAPAAGRGFAATEWDFLPEVVATFKGGVVRRERLRRELERLRPGIGLPMEARRALARQATREMVERVILVAMAERAGFKPSAQEVAEELDGILRTLAGDESLMATLGGKDEIARHKAELAGDRHHQEELAVRNWLESQTKGKLDISEAEIANFHHRNQRRFRIPASFRLRHILFRPASRLGADRRAAYDKARRMVEAIGGGADFATLARAESECPSGESGGGDLGRISPGQLVLELEQALESLPDDGQPRIVESRHGYHVVVVSERQAALTTPLDEARSAIAEILANRRRLEIRRKIVDETLGRLELEITIDSP